MKIRESNEQKTQYPFYYPVSVKKFLIMNLCTGGLYLIYWFYKSWSYIQKRDNNNKFWALVMAILSAIFFYPFIKDVNTQLLSRNKKPVMAPALLAICFFALNLTWRLPDPLWLPSLFLFICTIPVLKKINNLNRQSIHIDENSKFSKKNYFAIIFGSLCIIFVGLSTFNFIPSSHAISGAKISSKNLLFLRDNGLLENDETIVYFYSDGLFSIKGEGNFYTSHSVVSYENQSGELYGGLAYYNEIKDIKVEYSNSFLDNTIITITKIDGSSFILIVSTEEQLDKIFTRNLITLWQKNR